MITKGKRRQVNKNDDEQKKATRRAASLQIEDLYVYKTNRNVTYPSEMRSERFARWGLVCVWLSVCVLAS